MFPPNMFVATRLRQNGRTVLEWTVRAAQTSMTLCGSIGVLAGPGWLRLLGADSMRFKWNWSRIRPNYVSVRRGTVNLQPKTASTKGPAELFSGDVWCPQSLSALTAGTDRG